MIALCYWLLAQRIVQEADEAAAPRRREMTPDDAAGPDRAATGASS